VRQSKEKTNQEKNRARSTFLPSQSPPFPFPFLEGLLTYNHQNDIG